MAPRLNLPRHVPIEELERRYRGARDPVARTHFLIIWQLARGRPTTEVAASIGYSVTWVRTIAGRYRAGGPDALGDRRHGNPGATPLLNAAGKAALQQALGGPPPDGGLWTGRKVAAWMSVHLDRPVADQRGWEALRALGMSPQRPRPHEQRADPDAQAAFKKGGS